MNRRRRFEIIVKTSVSVSDVSVTGASGNVDRDLIGEEVPCSSSTTESSVIEVEIWLLSIGGLFFPIQPVRPN
jgi:hypothetical protein